MVKNSIKLIIIDLYGVMSRGSYKDTCRWISKKYGHDFDHCYDVVYFKHFTDAAMGRISEKESCQRTVKELNMEESGSEFLAKHLSFQKLNKSVFDYALSLKDRGYKILLLSKNTPGQFENLVKKYSLDKYFDVQNTYDLRLEKKDIRTIQYVLKKYKVRATEVFFVDDQDFNFPNAKKLGVHTYLYKNFKDFKTKLNSILNAK